jgi:hypothetical protein
VSHKPPICLDYTLTGSEYVVTREDSFGRECISLETDSLMSARNTYAGIVNRGTLPRIYRRTATGWRLTA